MNVPFLDLGAQYLGIRDEIGDAIQGVLDSCQFAGGPAVAAFEREWAAYCGAKHAIGVGNGTDALWLALRALGVGPGVEVITVPNTFVATVEAITLTGASPVLVDVDESSLTMDPGLLEAAITPRTRAIIPVHLFGTPADMDPILEIAARHGVAVLEDACQAHGAVYRGRKAGVLGDAAAFSFYPGKNLGAYGEAGAIVTDRDDVAAAVRMLRDHGQSRKYHHDVDGWNARMDGIQGAVLSVKLRRLDGWNERRRAWADLYTTSLDGQPGVVTPRTRPGCTPVCHVYAVRVEGRDGVLAAMQAEGITCGVHYPVPVHRQAAFPGLRGGSFPVAERSAGELLSLPMYPELGAEKVRAVVDALGRALRRAPLA
jgi:dTDP-4-amino-4,6-dideoxygalactose transaminase